MCLNLKKSIQTFEYFVKKKCESFARVVKKYYGGQNSP
jgi:hypothetical protein